MEYIATCNWIHFNERMIVTIPVFVVPPSSVYEDSQGGKVT